MTRKAAATKPKETLSDEEITRLILKGMETGLKPLVDRIEVLEKNQSEINQRTQELFAELRTAAERYFTEPERNFQAATTEGGDSPKIGRDPNFSLLDADPDYALDEMFRYHKPDEYSIEKHNELRMAAKSYARTMLAILPRNSALRRSIVYKIWETNMLANGVVATSGLF